MVTAIRPTTSPLTMTAILLVFGLKALQDATAALECEGVSAQSLQLLAGTGVQDRPWKGPRQLSEVSPVRDFFTCINDLAPGTLVHIPAGTPHGAGAGLRLIEFSNNSLTTLRCYDHGRRAGRRLHPVLCAMGLADISASSSIVERPHQIHESRMFSLGDIKIQLHDSHCGEPLSNPAVLLPGSQYVVTVLQGTARVSYGYESESRCILPGEAILLPADGIPRQVDLIAPDSRWIAVRGIACEESL